jgi:hypothetical protein
MDNSREFLKGGATPVVFTPRDIAVARTEAGRGGMLILSATSQEASRWFRFDPNIDFSRTMPEEDGQKTIDRKRRKAEGGWWWRRKKKIEDRRQETEGGGIQERTEGEWRENVFDGAAR